MPPGSRSRLARGHALWVNLRCHAPHPPRTDRLPQLRRADLAARRRGSACCSDRTAAARPTCWRPCRCWCPGAACAGARNAELRAASAGPVRWAVAGRFATTGGETDIGTGTPARRPARPTGVPPGRRAPRSQAEIADHVAAVWLTPQMDRLFQEGASGRRRFLDRLVWALEPGHAREVAAHDTAMAQRNRLLAERPCGPRLAGRPGGRDGAPRGGRHGRPDRRWWRG